MLMHVFALYFGLWEYMLEHWHQCLLVKPPGGVTWAVIFYLHEVTLVSSCKTVCMALYVQEDNPPLPSLWLFTCNSFLSLCW